MSVIPRPSVSSYLTLQNEEIQSYVEDTLRGEAEVSGSFKRVSLYPLH